MSDTAPAHAAEGGLTTQEARDRLRQVGPNRVADRDQAPLWRLALSQFESLVVLLLLAAAAIAWALNEQAESAAILAALVLNAAIGFGSEWRARVSLARLRELAVPQAMVRRDGTVTRVAAVELVPGDVLILDAGAAVPADARLLRAAALQVNESTLTGESAPVWKDADARSGPGTPLAERANMLYLGTTVLSGSGVALVTATGPSTELGRIGRLVAASGTRTTPLERQVEALGRRLIVLAVGICAIVGLSGVLHGEPVGLMLETAVSLAVAAVPEGLPAVVSLALAAGLWRLARRGALVRRLAAVDRVRLLEENRDLARAGLRVLAVGWRPVAAIEAATVEELTFLGFVGLVDPVRSGVADAIAACREAGIRTVMLTGDQELTAQTVGRRLGLEPEAIRSRVTPEGKLELVAELQGRGEIVAMTGDGVNDAGRAVAGGRAGGHQGLGPLYRNEARGPHRSDPGRTGIHDNVAKELTAPIGIGVARDS